MSNQVVLLEIGEWMLVKPQFHTRLQSIPIHKPCGGGCGMGRRVGYHVPKCSMCSQPVPDEIEAMYIIHNWDVRSV